MWNTNHVDDIMYEIQNRLWYSLPGLIRIVFVRNRVYLSYVINYCLILLPSLISF